MQSTASDQISQDFGIDRQKLQQWREKHDKRAGSDSSLTVHNGRDASAQYDRVFKIAALNRQIQALKRRRKVLGETISKDAALDGMIARSEIRREQLVEILRANG